MQQKEKKKLEKNVAIDAEQANPTGQKSVSLDH
jgi:hypothetical protein